jgi:hypothetical protein
MMRENLFYPETPEVILKKAIDKFKKMHHLLFQLKMLKNKLQEIIKRSHQLKLKLSQLIMKIMKMMALKMMTNNFLQQPQINTILLVQVKVS